MFQILFLHFYLKCFLICCVFIATPGSSHTDDWYEWEYNEPSAIWVKCLHLFLYSICPMAFGSCFYFHCHCTKKYHSNALEVLWRDLECIGYVQRHVCIYLLCFYNDILYESYNFPIETFSDLLSLWLVYLITHIILYYIIPVTLMCCYFPYRLKKHTLIFFHYI